MASKQPLDPRLTEQRNPATAEIDRLSPLEIVDVINAEDQKVAPAVAAQDKSKAAPAAQQRSTIPVNYHTLDNGLKVVLSRDTSSPIAVVGVYYNIGFRIEPKDRTGDMPVARRREDGSHRGDDAAAGWEVREHGSPESVRA